MNDSFSKVLIIHGNSQEILASAIILSRIGPQVHLASQGGGGLEMAETYDFDLIVLADDLEDFSPEEVLDRLSRENRSLTLVVLSKPMDEDDVRTKFSEALDVFESPQVPMKMVATICEHLIKNFECQNEMIPQLIIN